MKLELNGQNIDRVSAFLAAYLSWAKEYQVYATSLPIISYRGHEDGNWELLPSLCRQEMPVEILKQFEEEIIREFRSRLRLADRSDIDVLATARHHGAPTRLLDWSRNPFIGLWFAVANKTYDNQPGVVHQLVIKGISSVICSAIGFQLIQAEDCGCKKPVHVFSSPSHIERTERQRSVFTIASFKNDLALQPLDQIFGSEKEALIRKFSIPAEYKSELRRDLSELGLDAYSIYGDPDSLGKSLAAKFDTSDLLVSKSIPKPSE